MSFKQFAASELPANLSEAEAEARCGRARFREALGAAADIMFPHRYAEYKRNFAQQQHREYFAAHKDEEWMRQQFDPRRLEEAAKLRAEAAVQAAAEFSLAAALAETQPAAPGTADEPTARTRPCCGFGSRGQASSALTRCVLRRLSKHDAGRTTWRKRIGFLCI
jgi:uncharacterized membrane protein